MIRYEVTLPTVEGFAALRGETDWGVPSLVAARTALDRSLCGVTAWADDRLIGMARCVGDGVLIAYIQDVIVADDHRGQGVGRELIEHLIGFLKQECPPDCTIGLFAAIGQAGFYERFGFSERGNAAYGPGLHAPLHQLCMH